MESNVPSNEADPLGGWDLEPVLLHHQSALLTDSFDVVEKFAVMALTGGPTPQLAVKLKRAAGQNEQLHLGLPEIIRLTLGKIEMRKLCFFEFKASCDNRRPVRATTRNFLTTSRQSVKIADWQRSRTSWWMGS